jgi:hypothetical protein
MVGHPPPEVGNIPFFAQLPRNKGNHFIVLKGFGRTLIDLEVLSFGAILDNPLCYKF